MSNTWNNTQTRLSEPSRAMINNGSIVQTNHVTAHTHNYVTVNIAYGLLMCQLQPA